MYFLYNCIFLIFIYTPIVSPSIFMKLYTHTQTPPHTHTHTYEKNHNISSFPSLPSLAFYFHTMYIICFMHTSKICNIYISETVIFCWTQALLPFIFCICHNFIFLYNQIKLHYDCVLHFLFSFICWWASGWSPVLANVSNAGIYRYFLGKARCMLLIAYLKVVLKLVLIEGELYISAF